MYHKDYLSVDVLCSLSVRTAVGFNTNRYTFAAAKATLTKPDVRRSRPANSKILRTGYPQVSNASATFSSSKQCDMFTARLSIYVHATVARYRHNYSRSCPSAV